MLACLSYGKKEVPFMDDDVAIAERLRHAPQEAVRHLHKMHAPLLRGILLRMLGNAAEAEDVLQDVFVEVWRKAADYDPARGTVIAWLLQLTRSRGIDRIRKLRRQGDALERKAADEKADGVNAAGDTASHQLLAKETQAAVRAAMTELSAAQRNALELAFFQGLTHQEIAASLGVPLGTVKTRILTGVRVLRARLTTLEETDLS